MEVQLDREKTPIGVFTCVRLFLFRGEACLRPEWLGDHKDRPYMGRIHLKTTIVIFAFGAKIDRLALIGRIWCRE